MQFSLLYRYHADGPGPVESDIDAWMKFSADLEAAGALVHETGFFPSRGPSRSPLTPTATRSRPQASSLTLLA